MTFSWANAVDIGCWVLVVPILAYLAYRSFEQSDDRRGLIVRTVVSIPLVMYIMYRSHIRSPYTAMYILVPAVVLGFMWTPAVAAFLFRPLLGAFDGGVGSEKAKPFYFVVENKRRKGHYTEAIAEARKQLEKFPGDYEGYVRIASIQMEHLNDLSAATATLNEFLAFSNHPANEMVGALHLLADWQLQYARNAAAAELTLHRVIELYPNSQLAHAAEQRIAKLGSFDETMRARYEARFTVRTAGNRLADTLETSPSASKVIETEAEALIKQLEEHPNDTDAREKLAVLFAEGMQRLDLAMEQLEQLIAIPVERPKNIARWLDLLATLHVKCAADQAAAEQALRRIMDRFPGSGPAQVAEARIAGLGGEIKALQSTEIKPMGVYERNLGLRGFPK